MGFNLKKAQVPLMLQGPAANLYQWALQNMYIPPGTPPEAVVEMAQKAQAEAETTSQIADKVKENTEMNQEIAENTEDMKNIIPQSVPVPTEMGNMAAKTKINKFVKSFNLKKAQYDEGVGEPVIPMGDIAADNIDMMGDEYDTQQNVFQNNPQIDDSPKFQDGADLKDWLDSKDYETARTLLLSYLQGTLLEEKAEYELKHFYEDNLTQNDKLQKSIDIFNILPPQLKQEDLNDPANIAADYIRAKVEETNETIKKLAEEHVKKIKHTSFNLSKQAQHKVVENTFVYGPEQTRIDPFYRMPVSDYHIVERNKGYGIDFGGVWDADWEAMWRGSVMDKYSRPYKDKEGNWVGGYIQKRFEVDKNIPEQNNMQLKPGQKRKPVLPQYGSTESRLQAARSTGEIEGANNTDAPFNWKEASSKKKN